MCFRWQVWANLRLSKITNHGPEFRPGHPETRVVPEWWSRRPWGQLTDQDYTAGKPRAPPWQMGVAGGRCVPHTPPLACLLGSSGKSGRKRQPKTQNKQRNTGRNWAIGDCGSSLVCEVKCEELGPLKDTEIILLGIFRQEQGGQVKSSDYSPNFTEQTAHCDHKPRAAWVYVRLLIHWRSAAGWAECMIYSALVSFF